MDKSGDVGEAIERTQSAPGISRLKLEQHSQGKEEVDDEVDVKPTDCCDCCGRK